MTPHNRHYHCFPRLRNRHRRLLNLLHRWPRYSRRQDLRRMLRSRFCAEKNEIVVWDIVNRTESKISIGRGKSHAQYWIIV